MSHDYISKVVQDLDRDAWISEVIMGNSHENPMACQPYSTDPDACKQLKAKMVKLGWRWSVNIRKDGKVLCMLFHDSKDVCCEIGEDEERAVAEASMKAILPDAKFKVVYRNGERIEITND